MLIKKMYGVGVVERLNTKDSKTIDFVLGRNLYRFAYIKNRIKKYHYDSDSFDHCINNNLINHQWFLGLILKVDSDEE